MVQLPTNLLNGASWKLGTGHTGRGGGAGPTQIGSRGRGVASALLPIRKEETVFSSMPPPRGSKIRLGPEVSKKFKGLKLLVTVTVNLRIEVEVSKMKSILKLILSLIS